MCVDIEGHSHTHHSRLYIICYRIVSRVYQTSQTNYYYYYYYFCYRQPWILLTYYLAYTYITSRCALAPVDTIQKKVFLTWLSPHVGRLLLMLMLMLMLSLILSHLDIISFYSLSLLSHTHTHISSFIFLLFSPLLSFPHPVFFCSLSHTHNYAPQHHYLVCNHNKPELFFSPFFSTEPYY